MAKRRLLLGALLVVGVLTALTAARQEEPPLRWGGDKSGGGPYIIENADGSLSGFEVELAAVVAARLGRRPEFVQGQWDKLIDLTDRGTIDVVINGYEWSAERELTAASSIPYYVYRLQLMARANDDSIRSFDDLPGKRVGVLGGSAAERYLLDRFGEAVELKTFDGVTNVLRLVEQAQDLDATLQDVPIAVHYGRDFPGLRAVGEPVAPGYYVMFVRSEDAELRAKLDEAIRSLAADGTLERIYRSYGIWNEDQRRIGSIAPWPPAGAAPPPFSDRFPFFAETMLWAAGTTVLLACLSMPLAMGAGLGVATGRLYGPAWLRWALGAYVEILRGTPLLLQLYVIYYLLPGWGIRLPAFWAGVIGLAINYSAYEAEIYRAGLLAIPRGQMEAALALGMRKWTALRQIVIPQAVRLVVPPVTNDFIALFKDTSVCSVIAVVELTGRYNQLYNNAPRFVLQLGLMAALLYLLMSYPLALLARRLEQRLPRVVA